MTCVNQIYRGQFNCSFSRLEFVNLCLSETMPAYIHVKFYSRNPCMWKLAVPLKWTLLLFNSGKFRVMGKDFELDKILPLMKFILKCRIQDFPILQSETFVFVLSVPVDLHLAYQKLENRTLFVYEPELFPSLQILKWRPICVNVFHTGRCVILGRNARASLFDIINFLNATFVC